jgi:hypothetical protein
MPKRSLSDGPTTYLINCNKFFKYFSKIKNYCFSFLSPLRGWISFTTILLPFFIYDLTKLHSNDKSFLSFSRKREFIAKQCPNKLCFGQTLAGLDTPSEYDDKEAGSLPNALREWQRYQS